MGQVSPRCWYLPTQYSIMSDCKRNPSYSLTIENMVHSLHNIHNLDAHNTHSIHSIMRGQLPPHGDIPKGRGFIASVTASLNLSKLTSENSKHYGGREEGKHTTKRGR